MQAILSKKVRKYAVYAVGEVFLVVVGILIAFQIDTWNENRKLEILKSQYLQSLVSDLRADSTELSMEVKYYGILLDQLANISYRLSNPAVTRDTLQLIARYEFNPFFDPSNELNRSTLASLVSTGDIKLYESAIRDRLISFNTRQIGSIKLMDENVDIFMGTYQILNFPPVNHPLINTPTVRGPLMDGLWTAVSDQDLAEMIIRAISGKALMLEFVRMQKQFLLDATIDLLEYLRSEAG